jgi:hypothetical protein
MLLTMRTLTEGGRAFAVYVGQQLDIARYAEDAGERERAQRQVALLTPVAKAFFTDNGLESCVLGQQVFGGHGYIREWGQEQRVRDVRIAQIYEGTNGIQALDLLGRKVLGDGGQALASLVAEIRAFSVDAALHREALLEPGAPGARQPVAAGTGPHGCQPGQRLGGGVPAPVRLTAYAYMWARMAAWRRPARRRTRPSMAPSSTARRSTSSACCHVAWPWKPAFAPAAPACMGWRQSSSESSAHRGWAARFSKWQRRKTYN